MATKQDFTTEEWASLRDGALMVGMLTMVSGNSGITGSMAEAFEAGKQLVKAQHSGNPLIAALAAREEAAATQEEVKKIVVLGRPQAEIVSSLRESSLRSLDAALVALEAKAPDEVAVYKAYVMNTAFGIANAAKEGAFLGFGGERISDGEEAVLDELSAKLGIPVPTA